MARFRSSRSRSAHDLLPTIATSPSSSAASTEMRELTGEASLKPTAFIVRTLASHDPAERPCTTTSPVHSGTQLPFPS
eukprot:scaffold63629_cov63-Phaeocystis_antarctica.AAC.1